jgi:cell wall-associated NlpC family hydrolase
MQAVEEATKWVGKVYYTWNGALRSQPLHDGGATDCSGFVSLIWKEKFPDIPSTRAMMSRCQNTSAWKSSSSGNLKPGDIIVYGKEKPNPVTGKSSWSGHAMLYVGIVNGQQMVIEANGSKGDGKSVDYNGGVRYIHKDISRYNCIDMDLL